MSSNRSGMSSSRRISVMLFARNSCSEKPYWRIAASFTATKRSVLRSKTHIGTGLLSNKSRYCPSDRRNAISAGQLPAITRTEFKEPARFLAEFLIGDKERSIPASGQFSGVARSEERRVGKE